MKPHIINVAILDDHPVVRVGVKGILEENPTIKVTAEYATIKELMDDLQQNLWQILVLDIDLEDGNGIEVTEQILLQNPKAKILILSVYPEERYAIRAMKAGAKGYVRKDSMPQELVEATLYIAQNKLYVNRELGSLLASQAMTGSEATIAPHETLTNREHQVLCRLAQGQVHKDIGLALNISHKTVGTYKTRILEKMQLKTIADIINYANQHNLNL